MNQDERKMLEVVRDQFVTNETRIYDQVAAIFRWMMATLFAANGGAIIAIVGKGPDRPLTSALVWFSLGVVLTILMGAASTFVSLRAMRRITDARVQIEEALITGTLAGMNLDSFLEKQKVTWKTWVPSYVGAAAFLCFVAGLVTVGFSLDH